VASWRFCTKFLTTCWNSNWFKNGHYPNNAGHHAAIYIKQTNKGIWVWDQWLGTPVHKRLIRIRNDNASPGNTAQEYKVVTIK